MKIDQWNGTHTCALTLCMLALGCGSGDDGLATSATDDDLVDGTDASADGLDGCTAEQLEDDLVRMPLQGPGVEDGSVPSGDYVVSTTYLRLEDDAPTMMRFGELTGAMVPDLMAREGLVAMATAQSERCSVARTLTVWTDEMAMFGFVGGQAHLAAMAAVTDISRGGSIAMHWLGDESDANWESAARQLKDWDGRVH